MVTPSVALHKVSPVSGPKPSTDYSKNHPLRHLLVRQGEGQVKAGGYDPKVVVVRLKQEARRWEEPGGTGRRWRNQSKSIGINQPGYLLGSKEAQSSKGGRVVHEQSNCTNIRPSPHRNTLTGTSWSREMWDIAQPPHKRYCLTMNMKRNQSGHR